MPCTAVRVWWAFMVRATIVSLWNKLHERYGRVMGFWGRHVRCAASSSIMGIPLQPMLWNNILAYHIIGMDHVYQGL